MLNGHLLNERYKINNTIGGGGMANVYLARDTILERDVAIKVLRLEYANDDEFIARFDREAQSATSLSHPNIVNIFDVGEEDHILYMVMEYVDGLTLKEYIQKYGPINVEEALDIMKQISSAIGHAHANNIVHRDIKPQNILIDPYGQVKVTDFGIAVALSATALTQTNSILGSVHYLSPEQARGGMATKKSDIYSLGIVLFELLTARLPFSGQSPVSIALKHLQTDTPSVRRYNQDVPQSVENIVLKATAKDPFNRYETVYDMEDALATALDADKLNEAKFVPPTGVGEETKAIPIITDNQINENNNQNTIVHQSNGATKSYVTHDSEKPPDDKKKKKKKKEKKQSKKKKGLWITIILLILLALGVAALFLVPGLIQPADVTIPDVSNEEYQDAVEKLQGKNLITDKEMAFSEDVKEGNVISTNPDSGSTVKEESSVTLIVSKGKETVSFSDYVGQDYNQIKQILADKGFEVITIDKTSDESLGTIITQIQPAPDSDVVPSETKVIFEISSGPELITLNNLKGMTKDEATGYLQEQSLIANAILENSETTPEGEVIRQEPESGTEMEEGETVNIYISKGPEEKPPVSKTITFTVPYNPDQDAENGEQVAGESDKPKDPNETDNTDPNKSNESNPDKPTDPNKPENPVEQTVKIYIEDADSSISDVAQEDTITEDQEYKITLTINPDETAEYKVIRDGKVFINKTVSYEEGE